METNPKGIPLKWAIYLVCAVLKGNLMVFVKFWSEKGYRVGPFWSEMGYKFRPQIPHKITLGIEVPLPLFLPRRFPTKFDGILH